MPSLVRQQKTYFVDPAGKRVPKGTPGARKVKEKSRLWYGQGVPGQPPKKRVPLAADKTVARRMLEDLVRGAERGAAGIPAADRAASPLAPLLAEYAESLGRAACPKHVRTVVGGARKVLDGAGIGTVADLSAPGVVARVEGFVWSLVKPPECLAPKTAAYTGKYARQFTRWLWRKKDLFASDPLAGVSLPSQVTETARRPLSPDELGRLIAAAEASAKVSRRLDGRTRAILYLVAAATGFRAGELARLTPANFDLAAAVPVVRLGRKSTKNKKPAEQPLPPFVAEKLRGYLAGRPAKEPAWPGLWWHKAAKMMRVDLAAAGIPVVVGEEEAVFHSLRHSYTSMLEQVATVKVTQELARHASPLLTIGRYSHAGLAAKAEAVGKLPLPGAREPAATFAAMTRPELEATAELLVAFVAALAGILDTPWDTPAVEKPGDGRGHAGTKSAGRATA